MEKKAWLCVLVVLCVLGIYFSNAKAIIIETNGTRSLDYNGTSQKNSIRTLGIIDDTPSSSVLTPIICGKDATNSLDTLIAISNIKENNIVLNYFLFDATGNWVSEKRDISFAIDNILAFSCKEIVNELSAIKKVNLEKSISGKTYYVGYVIFTESTNSNWIAGWSYLIDLTKGFAAGFNGYTAQNLVRTEGENFCEMTSTDTYTTCSTASYMYPRFFLMNNHVDTYNWWIIMAGNNSISRKLNGKICNEQGICASSTVSIPDRINIINVGSILPQSLFTGSTKAGYGIFNVQPYINEAIFGWSYQRAASNNASLSWSVIHPIYKEY